MKSCIAVVGLLLLARGVFAQEPSSAEVAGARERAAEVRRKCAARIEGLDGIQSIGLGGSGTDFRLLVVVRDPEARRLARGLLGGDQLEGIRILWSVRQPTLDVPAALASPPPLNLPQGPAAPASLEARPGSEGPSMYDCDIIREHLKLRPIPHPAGDGRTLTPCQLVRRTVEGSPGAPIVLYAKHRADCPVYLGQVAPPAVADAFVAWVFQQGASEVSPDGTPRPSDLRPGVAPVPQPVPPPAYPSYPYGWVPTWHRHGWIVFNTCCHTWRGWCSGGLWSGRGRGGVRPR